MRYIGFFPSCLLPLASCLLPLASYLLPAPCYLLSKKNVPRLISNHYN
ncbi:MAG: hypothetical protein F6J90_10810 [Moorea sp. SIOASIH]|nr:hypothetical protein [Moorena sp. SIOASIH]NEO36772.1 hypothetical protein [Moorena sp. SIOASIH]